MKLIKKYMSKKIENRNLLRGSGVLVVVLSAITFTIYISSTFSEQEHLAIMQSKYEKNIIQIYETLYNKYYE